MTQPKDTASTAENQLPSVSRQISKPISIKEYEFWLYAFLTGNIGRRLVLADGSGESILLSLEITDEGFPRATFYNLSEDCVFSSRLGNVSILPVPLSHG